MLSAEDAKKINLVRELFVAQEMQLDVLNAMQRCMDSHLFSKPDCLFVTGDTGSGKTTLIEQFVRKHPNTVNSEQSEKPILFTTLPENASPETASKQLLYDLGDPLFYDSKDPSLLRSKVTRLLEKCNVKLIVIDEFQHMIERGTSRVIHRTTDWLKLLISLNKAPIVVFGMPYSEVILKDNSQLSERLSARFHLAPFRVVDSQERKRYLTFLHELGKHLPFNRPINWEEDHLHVRLYAYSKGNMRRLRSLINEAARIAIMEKSECCQPDHFLRAYSAYAHQQEINVFQCNINKVKLSEPGKDIGWEDFIRRNKDTTLKTAQLPF